MEKHDIMPHTVVESTMHLWKVHAPEKSRGLYTLGDSTAPPTPIHSNSAIEDVFSEEEMPQGVVHVMVTTPVDTCKIMALAFFSFSRILSLLQFFTGRYYVSLTIFYLFFPVLGV